MASASGYIFWYNQRWYDYTGTTFEQMRGWGWQKVHHPKEVGRVVERIKKAFATGEPWEDTFPLRGKDGEYRWFLSRALPIRDVDGEVVCWFGTNTDVTDQMRMEQALRKSREELEERVAERTVELSRANAILVEEIAERRRAEEAVRCEKEFSDTTIDSLPGVFYHFDEDGRLLRWNENFERVTGYSREEIARMRALDFFVGDDRRRIKEKISLVFAKGEETAEADFICKDGRAIPYYFTGRRVLFDAKPCLVGVGIDISERKRAEEALRASKRALRESYNRIQDLAGRLIVAQEEERKHIARELHDDLNQQVAALAIGLGKIERQLPELSGPARDHLTKLEDRATELSERIRRLSHELHSSTLEHVGLAEALQLHCSEFSDQQGIAVSLGIDGDIEPLSPDVALCLYRVAQEALRNVFRHSGAKSAEVRLAANGEGIEMRVADRGRGFNLEEASKRGLGLVSMEERVRLLGGILEIKSRPGYGTELRVQVPAGAIHE
jgi:PAS domain S-box-containing protein